MNTPLSARRPRACLFCREDIGDPKRFSGMPYAVYQGMKTWADVLAMFPLRMPVEYAYTPWVHWHRWRGRVFHRAKALGTARQRAAYARRLEAREAFDFWIMPMLDYAAFIEGERPIVTFDDAPFTQLMELYDTFRRMPAGQKRDMWLLDRAAVARADRMIFASDWAARWAIDELGAAPEKVRVVPFGANIEPVPAAEAEATVARRLQSPHRLLFVGQDWERKGGPLVLEAFERLRRHHGDLELHLVGRVPLPLGRVREGVENHGYLKLADPADRARRDALYRSASVLVVPSQAEGLGIVFCEAAAMAMPSVGRAVGGIPTVVRDGVTGRLVSPEATAGELAAAIADVIATPDAYRRLALAAHRDQHERLNWRRFDRDLQATVTEMLAATAGAADRAAC